ncbi:MAG: hypothetical protein NTX50_16455 [Candidatus Sumerlaeota bacterium]|nr:hypothetical protein [Candidatus Sumerlaeota bacterium]
MMHAALVAIKPWVIAGPHGLAFLVAAIVLFASAGIAAKWSVWWSWVITALTLLYIIGRLVWIMG